MKVVLVRHGQSMWNLANRFTGWVDVDLSGQGMKEALEAGKVLKKEGYSFDIAFNSVLTRAIRTLWIILDELDLMWLPVQYHWRLNERHYGALQGLNKKETVEKHGEEKVHIWRRSFDTPPPPLDEAEAKKILSDPRYQDVKDLIRTESLKDTEARTLPYWHETIVPEIKAGKRVLISAHGNSMRALVKHFDNISDEEISNLNIPTGIPLVYEFDQNLNAINRQYLGDPEAVRKATEAVAKQAKKK